MNDEVDNVFKVFKAGSAVMGGEEGRRWLRDHGFESQCNVLGWYGEIFSWYGEIYGRRRFVDVYLMKMEDASGMTRPYQWVAETIDGSKIVYHRFYGHEPRAALQKLLDFCKGVSLPDDVDFVEKRIMAR